MLGASLLQLTPEEELEIKGAIQAIRAHAKDQELVEKEKELLEMEARLQEQQLIPIKKAKILKKSTMEATWVAAQLRLMAGHLDRLADQIIESSK